MQTNGHSALNHYAAIKGLYECNSLCNGETGEIKMDSLCVISGNMSAIMTFFCLLDPLKHPHGLGSSAPIHAQRMGYVVFLSLFMNKNRNREFPSGLFKAKI